jgi:hypothetical protein
LSSLCFRIGYSRFIAINDVSYVLHNSFAVGPGAAFDIPQNFIPALDFLFVQRRARNLILTCGALRMRHDACQQYGAREQQKHSAPHNKIPPSLADYYALFPMILHRTACPPPIFFTRLSVVLKRAAERTHPLT